MVGIDIGGTLAKIVFFECHDFKSSTELPNSGNDAIIAVVRDFIKSTYQYGMTGERDARLEMKNLRIGTLQGNLHFIRFPTSRMESFFKVAQEMKANDVLQRKVCATGGGAYKFENKFKEVHLDDILKLRSKSILLCFHGVLSNV